MKYVGKWKFHSIGTVDDITNERVWLDAEEYIKAPMPYIDESDVEEVTQEQNERTKTVGMMLEVCKDGTLYVLKPMPEGVSQEEVDTAVQAGVIKVRDGMMTDTPLCWEEKEGELWVNFGYDSELQQFSGDGDFLTMGIIRFIKV